jgi:hypothetical protein
VSRSRRWTLIAAIAIAVVVAGALIIRAVADDLFTITGTRDQPKFGVDVKKAVSPGK